MDPEAHQPVERTGTLKSLTSILKPPTIRMKRRHLARYSWLPDVLRYKGSVIRSIAGPVLTVTIFASIVAYLDMKGSRINLPNNVVPLLSVVVGLILVFRTSYDRWNEGRRDFAIMTSNIRNLSRNIWTVVQLPDDQGEATTRYMNSLPTRLQKPQLPRSLSGSSSDNAHHHAAAFQNLGVSEHLKNEKIRVIKLLIAFAFATKRHLRGESGLGYNDYDGLLPPELYREEASGWERTVATSPDHIISPTVPTQGSHARSRFSTIKQPTVSTPLLTDSQRTVEFHAYLERKHMPLPLIIAHEVSRALYRFKRFSCLDVVGPAMQNGMQTILQSMVDQLTVSMDLMSQTYPKVLIGNGKSGKYPYPCEVTGSKVAQGSKCHVDSIHLKQCVTLYLFALPFTLVGELGFMMIPVVTVVAFTLMGIEGIADEIEHPFGNHPNSHPLDKFCAELREEMMFMMERLPEGLEEDS